MKFAFFFPGQGSQSVGMGQDLYNNYSAAKNIFDTADKVLGKSISKICFDGDPRATSIINLQIYLNNIYREQGKEENKRTFTEKTIGQKNKIKTMRNKYIAPDLEIILISLQVDILGVSNPENSTPEEGGDLPRDGLDNDLFG